MKRTLLLVTFMLCCASNLLADSTSHFMRRYGPNSVVYNEPLYFSSAHLYQKNVECVEPIARSHRQPVIRHRTATTTKAVTPTVVTPRPQVASNVQTTSNNRELSAEVEKLQNQLAALQKKMNSKTNA